LTGAARVGVALVSADGQFAEHLATGDPAETAEPETAWLVALTASAHRLPGAQASGGCEPPGQVVPGGSHPPLAGGPFLTVPLTYADRYPGVLYVVRPPGEAPFGPDQVQAARLIGACF